MARKVSNVESVIPWYIRAGSAVGRVLALVGPPLLIGGFILAVGLSVSDCEEKSKAHEQEQAEQAAACDMWRVQVQTAETLYVQEGTEFYKTRSSRIPADLIASRPAGCSPVGAVTPAKVEPLAPADHMCPCITVDSRGKHCRPCREEYGPSPDAARYGRY